MALVTNAVLDGEFDLCVVGAGPAGLACAFASTERGLRVLVLDAGGEKPVPGRPDVLAADLVRTDFHDSTELTTASALGGASHWWGGRCMPLDEVDFDSWPVKWEEVSPWWNEAGDRLGVGPMQVTPAPGKFANLRNFDATGSESWANESNMSRRWKKQIHASNGPAILLNARVMDLIQERPRRVAVKVRHAGADRMVLAQHVVIACGGLGSMRLMLNAQRNDPTLFGGPQGPLGRGYVGHMTGYIANMIPADPSQIPEFCLKPIPAGGVARRRIRMSAETLRRENLANISFWLDAPPIVDPQYGWAAGSARYLAASAFKALRKGARPTEPLEPHMRNVMNAPLSAAIESIGLISHLAKIQFLGRAFPIKLPRKSNANGWCMKYHAEQRPDPYNRVSLSENLDSVGLPKLKIDFRMRDEDLQSIVRAHDILDADLRDSGAGALTWTTPLEERIDRVRMFSRDGYHQMGGANMSADPRDGVVDSNCKAHGLENLWVASGAVFPTGGQANPTLSVVGFALRLADHLASLQSTKAAPVRTPKLASADA